VLRRHFLLLFVLLSSQAWSATLSNLIVDQFGWRSGSAKVAILAQPATGTGSPSAFTPGGSFEIRRVSDNGLAYSGTPVQWNGGATHTQSGDKGWNADFSSLTVTGSYYLTVPGGSNAGARSYNFDVKEDAFAEALKASVRTFYYQRCGTAITATYGGAWNHAACHTAQATAHLYDGADLGLPRDVTGGWHDAGDYRKYVSFTFSVLWDLMSAYEWYSCSFPDNTGIPESGNGVPDLLDEVKVELDWLLKMQRGDGALYSGVFVTTNGSNGGSGDPSAENTTYWYANYSSAATSTGAMAFAKAAPLFAAYGAQYPGYSASLLAAAANAWTWLQAHPTNVTYNHTNFSNANANVAADEDARRRVAAAAELFKATGTTAYKTYFDANYNSAATADNGGSYHPITNNEFWPGAAASLERGLVSYAQAPGATAGVVTAIKNALKAGADNRLVADQTANTDLYRGYMWDGYYGWGSNAGKSWWGGLGLWAVQLNCGTAANRVAYRAAAEEYLHYIHGRNPLNWVYLSNMGPEGANAGAEQSITNFFHGWFFDGTQYDGFGAGNIGPAPGFLAGGPNQSFAPDASYGGTINPPQGQPMMKAYKDWNTSWPQNSWEVTESAIYYQAAYTLLAAGFAPCAGPQPTATVTQTVTPFAGSPTDTATPTMTDSFTPSPTPVCGLLLNGAESLGENGTWSGTSAVRSIVSAGSAPAGAVTQGSNGLYVNITVSAGWNDQMANLAGFAPSVWTGYIQLAMDVNVAASVVAGAGYSQLLLRADCATCGAGLWYQPISADQPNLVAGQQTVTWALDFSAGTLPAGAAISNLTLIYNNNASTATGAIYVDNVRLIGPCFSPTSTRSPSPSRTATRSATPSLTPSATATPSLTGTPSPNPTITATFTDVPAGSTFTETPSESPSFTESPSPSPSATASDSPSPSATPPATATVTGTFSATRSSTITLTPTATPPSLSCPRNVWLFYPYWTNGSVNAGNLPFSKMTHLAHAFIGTDSGGNLQVPSGYLDPAVNSAAHAAGVKMIVSIGGANSGTSYRPMAASTVARANFVNQVEAFMRANQYDGVDIDWEFPSNNSDRNNLNSLVMELRAKFSASAAPAPGWIISGDLSYGSFYGQWWDVATLKNYMNYFNIMIYDMYGCWETRSGHNTALYDSTLNTTGQYGSNNGDSAIAYYLSRGLPGGQLQYGLAFYGYHYDSPALYQPWNAACNASSATQVSYGNIAQSYLGSGWTANYDASAQTAWAPNGAGTEVLSYDNPQSIGAKVGYALNTRGLAGTFAWEITQDDWGNGLPLLTAMWNASQCVVPSPTPTQTPNGTFTITPTFSASPTISPTPSITATFTPALGGPLAVEKAVAVPNPNPRELRVLLGGPADELRVRWYSVAGTCLKEQAAAGPWLRGWNGLPVDLSGLPHGLLYGVVEARRDGKESLKNPIVKVWLAP
jgi:GH18 family chitinase